MRKIKCLYCRKTKIARSSTQKFCNEKCWKKFYSTHKCLVCGKLTYRSKYCSRKCYYLSKTLQKVRKKCLVCRKTFFVIPSRKEAKYCSSKCFGKINGHLSGKISAENNKKNKKGFWSSEFQSEMGKRVTFETRSKAGVNAQHTLRINIRNLKYKGQYYDSSDEAGISAALQEQFEYIPKEGKNLHIKIKGGEIDYLIEKLKLFIEYHVRFDKLTFKQYYNKRRKILDENGYKDYDLLVIR